LLGIDDIISRKLPRMQPILSRFRAGPAYRF
jgi:hypothetical protein